MARDGPSLLADHRRARRATKIDRAPWSGATSGRMRPGDLARDHQIFTGKLVKKHLSFPDRVIASATRVQEGDFRNWDDIRAWATSIADTLLAS